jgi:hypothetical protein
MVQLMIVVPELYALTEFRLLLAGHALLQLLHFVEGRGFTASESFRYRTVRAPRDADLSGRGKVVDKRADGGGCAARKHYLFRELRALTGDGEILLPLCEGDEFFGNMSIRATKIIIRHG